MDGDNSLATWSIGLLVTLIILLVAVLVGGAMAGEISDVAAAESFEDRVEWTIDDPDNPGIVFDNSEEYDVFDSETGEPIDGLRGEPVELVSVEVNGVDETADATLTEDGIELEGTYEIDDEVVAEVITESGGNPISGSIDTIIDSSSTAFVLFGIGLLVIPAVAVIVLIVSGFGDSVMGRTGR